MTSADQVAGAPEEVLRERLRLALATRLLLRMLTVGFAAAGFAVLAIRVAIPSVGRPWLLAAPAAAIALSWAASLMSAARRTPSRVRCVAAVDAASGGGGLFMSREEASRAGWRADLSGAVIPAIAYRPGRALWPPLLMLAFVVAVIAVPASLFARAFAQQDDGGLGTLVEA